MAPRKKAAPKKQQKRGVDFKKYRRKIGRKLPPAQNATNTEIKAKSIVLPEQSVAAEKAGLAVNKRGLTLKELLQQTSHPNPRVRKDALLGIKDLFLKYPEELRLHKYAVMEKLRERIGDDDSVVRETLYNLSKTVIFPGCKEDNPELFISLIMAYIFNAMTHLAIDVRLMAFKFLELVIQYHPPSFFLYAEKILQNFEDILRRNQFHVEDKKKLKVALAGLELCLSLLPCNNREVASCEKDENGQGALYAFKHDAPAKSTGCLRIIPKLKDLVPVLVNCFQDFIPEVHNGSLLDAQSFDCMLSILHSISLAVKFVFYMTEECKPELRSSKGGLDVTMCGVTICMTLLKKLLVLFPLSMTNQHSEKDNVKYLILNTVMTEIFLHSSKWTSPPAVLLEKVLEFLENSLFGKDFIDARAGKAVWENQLVSLLPFVSKLVSQVADGWKFRLLQAFTETFKECNPLSSLKLACLSVMEEMLVPRQDRLYLDPCVPWISDFQIGWIRELPMLLIQLGDKKPSCSQVVLHLLLRLGQCASVNSSSAWEYENIQFSLQEFFSIYQDDGDILYGPFLKLPRDSQELSLCCLYYFSNMDSCLLKSIACCCLCPDLEPYVLFRIIEVLHSAYKSGHIQLADQISFYITLISRFRVFPENIYPVIKSDAKISNRGTFKSLTSIIWSCLSQMGDNSLVFQMLEKLILDQMLQSLPLDNMCAMLRVFVQLDSEATSISQTAFMSLGNILPRYLIDVVRSIAEDDKVADSIRSSARCYYVIPCFILFGRNHKLLNLALKTLVSWIHLPPHNTETAAEIASLVDAIVSLLVLMRKDHKIQQIMSSFKAEINCILESINFLQSSNEIRITIEERHKVQCAHGRLKNVTSTLT